MFDALFVPAPVRRALDDRAFVQAMLDSERALAVASASAGLVPLDAVQAIAAQCSADLYDPEQIGLDAWRVGNPAEPLVRALRDRVGGAAAAYVHRGATSQDIVDTAAMLVTRRALVLIDDDLDAVERACAALARDHRDTPMVARTLLQHALPTTFGLKAAGWLMGVVESRRLLDAARDRLAVQLGGAAGTLASFGGAGLQVADRMGAELGLAVPALPWHSSRTRIAALGGALVAVSGALAKVALDVVLLAQTEVAEVAEASGDGRGGSSTLPHKRNPIGATRAIACARRVGAAAALLCESMPHEHERAAGAWHAEWEGLVGALAGVAGAAGALREVLEGLELDVPRMRANLELTRGLIMAEHVQQALVARVGDDLARAIVAAAAARSADRSTGFGDELAADPRMPLRGDELAPLLDPSSYLGVAGELVDRVLGIYSNRLLEG